MTVMVYDGKSSTTILNPRYFRDPAARRIGNQLLLLSQGSRGSNIALL